jgi:ribosome-associated heat shock protein Hsp15
MAKLSALENATRIDKWLWAARFFKTRSLATDAIDAGHVRRAGLAGMNGDRIKPALIVRTGDAFVVQRGDQVFEFVVTQVSDRRGSATDAALLYQETEQSVKLRLDRKALSAASEIQHSLRGRPTKYDRRKLAELFSRNYPDEARENRNT